MTKLSKILCVFVVTSCLAFLGVATVLPLTGVNWDRERAELAGDFLFESTTSEADGKTWSVKTRRGDKSLVSGAKSKAAVVLASRRHMVKEQTQKISDLKTRIPKVQQQVTYWTTTTTVDRKAIGDRNAKLAQDLAALNQTLDELTKSNILLGNDTFANLQLAKSRREEVHRLLDQFSEVQTDLYQINEQQKRLRDLLVRTRGVVDRLERRQTQLVKSGAQGKYEKDVP